MHRAATAATGIAPLVISSAQWRNVAGHGHLSGAGDLRRANEYRRPETDYYQESNHVSPLHLQTRTFCKPNTLPIQVLPDGEMTANSELMM
jgi:hypothetical protein